MDRLKNPLQDRRINDVPPPPSLPLDGNKLFPGGFDGPPDWKLLMSNFFSEGRIHKDHCFQIIRQFTAITSAEPNMLTLQDPVVIVGDIHGQYYDLLQLIELGGDPDAGVQYLFLGDYVDRGAFSIEVMLLLMAIKINYRDNVWVLRGNHECRHMTAFFNFRDECLRKFDMTVYNAFTHAFDTLPLCALVNDRMFSVHGGISPDLKKKEKILSINRFQEPPRSGAFCDLLWADPVDENKAFNSVNSDLYIPNDIRGCSYLYGFQAARTFLDENKLLTIIRAHEAQIDGYKMHKVNPVTNFPTVITIFSAPNYCDVYNNKAAILKFKNNTVNIQQFNCSSHPYVLPNYLDLFEWCIPFLSLKLSEMLAVLVSPPDMDGSEVSVEHENCAEGLLGDDPVLLVQTLTPPSRLITNPVARRIQVKVLALSRFFRVIELLRERSADIEILKKHNEENIPYNLLLGGNERIDAELDRIKLITTIQD